MHLHTAAGLTAICFIILFVLWAKYKAYKDSEKD